MIMITFDALAFDVSDNYKEAHDRILFLQDYIKKIRISSYVQNCILGFDYIKFKNFNYLQNYIIPQFIYLKLTFQIFLVFLTKINKMEKQFRECAICWKVVNLYKMALPVMSLQV